MAASRAIDQEARDLVCVKFGCNAAIGLALTDGRR
jgi:hypothetical protein